VQKIGHLSLLVAVRTHRVAMQLIGLFSSITGGTICSNKNTAAIIPFKRKLREHLGITEY